MSDQGDGLHVKPLTDGEVRAGEVKRRNSWVWLIVAVVITTGCALILPVLLVASAKEPDPISYSNIPFPVTQTTLVPGQAIPFLAKREFTDPIMYYPFRYSIDVDMVDDSNGFRHSLPSQSDVVPSPVADANQPLNPSRFIVPTDVAHGTYPGSFHLEGWSSGTKALGGKFLVPWSTTSFQVIDAGGPP